jgi:hypothetical protein
MKNEDIIACCADYGITVDELRLGAVSELLVGNHLSSEKGDGLAPLVSTLNSVLTDEGVASAVKWATWAKHANTHGLPGGHGVEELINVRQEGIEHGAEAIQASPAAAG